MISFGSIVKMSDELKQQFIKAGCKDHVNEFGDCFGIVEGLLDYPDSVGPEVDVRWLPSKLRYGYNPNDLVEVDKKFISLL